jgi:hypothetical protein
MDAPRGQVWSWMQSLPQTIQQCLNRWQIEWTGESLKQGYFSYVLPCRRQDSTSAILKLSPDAQMFCFFHGRDGLRLERFLYWRSEDLNGRRIKMVPAQKTRIETHHYENTCHNRHRIPRVW